MKEITLSNSHLKAFVDDGVFDLLSEFTWRMTDNGYAAASIRMSARPSRTINMYMHRVIMGAPPCDIDHKDTNKLNNQASNLRACSRSENLFNVFAKRTNKIGFKGVRARGRRWYARIVAYGKAVDLGAFSSPALAAKAYNAAAIKLHGEFARINPI